MDNQKDKIVLTGEDAFENFLAVKEVWNAYAVQYLEAEVDFSDVDFSQYGTVDHIGYDFSGYLFPKKGDVFF
ncbi:hypothetical protein [Neptunomonas qingdaonensis]|uniref:Uncharacterized protein n=1 Tax=Neptunomonas qingdaonensis TaxID=1045558 RepID=A0A1I2TMX1_9GAMM|nr:hypothetical protein [Neptunomonas qingdaonensis]SFG66163.1 hypothetical protein SAMN05216175_110138 [Neptunomonas qingdaonensis]